MTTDTLNDDERINEIYLCENECTFIIYVVNNWQGEILCFKKELAKILTKIDPTLIFNIIFHIKQYT